MRTKSGNNLHKLDQSSFIGRELKLDITAFCREELIDALKTIEGAKELKVLELTLSSKYSFSNIILKMVAKLPLTKLKIIAPRKRGQNWNLWKNDTKGAHYQRLDLELFKIITKKGSKLNESLKDLSWEGGLFEIDQDHKISCKNLRNLRHIEFIKCQTNNFLMEQFFLDLPAMRYLETAHFLSNIFVFKSSERFQEGSSSVYKFKTIIDQFQRGHFRLTDYLKVICSKIQEQGILHELSIELDSEHRMSEINPFTLKTNRKADEYIIGRINKQLETNRAVVSGEKAGILIEEIDKLIEESERFQVITEIIGKKTQTKDEAILSKFILENGFEKNKDEISNSIADKIDELNNHIGILEKAGNYKYHLKIGEFIEEHIKSYCLAYKAYSNIPKTHKDYNKALFKLTALFFRREIYEEKPRSKNGDKGVQSFQHDDRLNKKVIGRIFRSVINYGTKLLFRLNEKTQKPGYYQELIKFIFSALCYLHCNKRIVNFLDVNASKGVLDKIEKCCDIDELDDIAEDLEEHFNELNKKQQKKPPTIFNERAISKAVQEGPPGRTTDESQEDGLGSELVSIDV